LKITSKTTSQQAHDRAEAAFKKKETQLREGRKAMAEYNANCIAVREKTARLRALRLARDAADGPDAVTAEQVTRAGHLGQARRAQ
jgi:hypothetical protein